MQLPITSRYRSVCQRLILALLTILWFPATSSPGLPHDSIFSIKEPKDFFPLNLASFILKDDAGILKIDNVIKLGDAFQPIKEEMYGLRQDKNCKVYWLRCKVQNSTAITLHHLVCLQPGVDSVDLFVFNPDSTFNHSSIASFQKTRTRHFFISRELALPIDLQPGVTTIYLRLLNESIWSRERANVILSLADENSFVNYFLESRFYQGAALGMIFLILVLHVFIYLFSRDFTYLVYLINIFLTLIYLLLRKNYQLDFDFLSPAFPLLHYFHDPIDFLLVLTAVWFCQLFLNTREGDPLLDRIMTGIKIALGICCVWATSLQYLIIVNLLSVYIALASAGLIVVVSVRSYRRGNRLALYVLGGFVPLAFATAIYIVPNADYLHFRSNESDIHYFAEAIRAIIFSIGIADRFYQFKKEAMMSKIEQERLKFNQQKQIQHEKERISRDLHDNIGSRLAVLSLELGSISNEHASDPKITAAQENAHHIINELRDTVWAIESNQVTMDDFENKLNTLMLSFRKKITTIDFTLEIPEPIKLITLKPSQAIHLYRVIQEAIQNAIKHSKCSSIQIQFSFVEVDKVMTARILDNGVGFQEEIQKGDMRIHYGIKNMKRRANEINGKLEIQNGNTTGTVVSLSFSTYSV